MKTTKDLEVAWVLNIQYFSDTISTNEIWFLKNTHNSENTMLVINSSREGWASFHSGRIGYQYFKVNEQLGLRQNNEGFLFTRTSEGLAGANYNSMWD